MTLSKGREPALTVNIPTEKNGCEPLSDALLLGLGHADLAERQRAIDEAARDVDARQLVGMIAGDDVIRRNSSLAALTKGGRRSVPALLQSLQDRDPEVVMFATSTLGKTRDPAVVPELIGLLRHGDINVVQAAIESLGQLRAAAAVEPLEHMVTADLWLRFAAVHALGEIGQPRAVRTLIPALGDDEIRESAIDALGKIRSPEAIATIVQLLLTSNRVEDIAPCLRALGRILAHTPDPESLEALPAWCALVEASPRRLAPLLTDILRTAGRESWSVTQVQTRIAAVELVRVLRMTDCYDALVAAGVDPTLTDALLAAMVHLGRPTSPRIVAALDHPDRHLRLFACRAAGVALFDEGAEGVARLLQDPDEEIRAAALTTLARLGSNRFLPQMLARLGDDSPRVEGAAIEALSRMDAQAVSEVMLRSPSITQKYRRQLLSVVRENPAALQRAFLEACLRDPDQDVRCTAVATLANHPDSDNIDSVAELLSDPEVDVRREVFLVLARHRSQRTRELLLRQAQHDEPARIDAVRALARVGDDRLVTHLIALYADSDIEEKLAIIETLGALEAPCSEPFLSRQLRHTESSVRGRAVVALARIGTPAALQYLSSCVADPEARVRRAVADALASSPHPLAREALDRLSVDEVPAVAAAARSHLGA